MAYKRKTFGDADSEEPPCKKAKIEFEKHDSLPSTQLELSEAFPLKKIISGGQTGADMGGLLAGKILRIDTGGTAPAGFNTLKGNNPSLGTKFGLVELEFSTRISVAQMYVRRSMKNVDDSDGTIAFRTHNSVGTDKTIGYCLEKKWKKVKIEQSGELYSKYKPLFLVANIKVEQLRKLLPAWIIKHNIQILNVCGHREESLEIVVRDTLCDVFQNFLISESE